MYRVLSTDAPQRARKRRCGGAELNLPQVSSPRCEWEAVL